MPQSTETWFVCSWRPPRRTCIDTTQGAMAFAGVYLICSWTICICEQFARTAKAVGLCDQTLVAGKLYFQKFVWQAHGRVVLLTHQRSRLSSVSKAISRAVQDQFLRGTLSHSSGTWFESARWKDMRKSSRQNPQKWLMSTEYNLVVSYRAKERCDLPGERKRVHKAPSLACSPTSTSVCAPQRPSLSLERRLESSTSRTTG